MQNDESNSHDQDESSGMGDHGLSNKPTSVPSEHEIRSGALSSGKDGEGDEGGMEVESEEHVSHEEDLACCVVGIGASAGGLESITSFFSEMPSDTGLSFVIVQHLDPDHETLLPEILGRHTSMSTHLVEDGMEVEPNSVYIIAPNTLLTLRERHLYLSPFEEPRRLRTPIDTFFRSLAQSEQEKAIAIILSGKGSDGSLGLKEVKEYGGMVLAQDPETARFASMPISAIQTGLVDFVLDPAMMAEKVIAYDSNRTSLQLATVCETLHDQIVDHLGIIIAHLRKVVGHDFSSYKQSTLSRRIQRRLKLLNIDSVDAYVDYLRSDLGEAEDLFRDFLISVTYFFRDPDAFQTIAMDIISTLVSGDHEVDQERKTIRVWVPGCATGEEAYTLAMIIIDYIDRHQIEYDVKIFATDIDVEGLEFGRKGSYPEGIAEQIPPSYLDRFFTQQGHRYRVTKRLRDCIIFSQHNIVKDPPFSRLDLVSCRNLLIYLEQGEQTRILNMLHYSLRGEGFLFLGSSENAAGHSNLFRTVSKKHRIFRKKEPRLGSATGMVSAGFDRSHFIPVRRGASTRSEEKVKAQHIIERVVLESYAPTYVVVDEHFQVLYTSGKTADFLELPAGDISTNVIDMARKGLRLDLRTLLHAAARRGSEVVKENVSQQILGVNHRLKLIARPVHELDADGAFIMVVFQDLGPVPTTGKDTGDQEIDDEHPVVRHLEDELRTTREQLQTTVEELETTNEELKSSNEELLSMNEELQSSNEELQTSKEEIQSINEELYTVNAELNQKMDEVNRSNSDLQNLLQSTQIPTIFVGSDLRIKRFTPETSELLRIIDGDIGRSIGDVKTRFTNGDLEGQIREVIRTLQPFEETVSLIEDDRSFVIRVLPYRTVANVIEGVVITFIDVTPLQKAKEREKIIEAMMEHVPEGIMLIDAETMRIRMVSRFGREMFERRAGDLVGREMNELNIRMIHEDGVNPYLPTEFPVTRALKQGELVMNEKLYLHLEGEEPIPILCNAAPVYDDEGKIIAGVATWRDIGLLEKAREALVESERSYREAASELEVVYQNTPIGLSLVDRNYLYVRLNEHLARIHGLTVEEHIGKSLFELFPVLAETVKPIFDRIYREGTSAMNVEFATPSLNTKGLDDTVYHWSESYYPLKNEMGEVDFIISVVQDITSRYRYEQQLKSKRQELAVLNAELEGRVENRTEQVRALSAALSMAERSECRRLSFMLHDDLQQMLFGLEMKLEILRQLLGHQSAQEGEERTDLTAQLEDIAGTVRQTIAVTRTLSVELNPPIEHDSRIDTSLQWLARHMEEQYGLHIELEIGSDIHLSNPDHRALMIQVLRELLFNVLKHSHVTEAVLRAGVEDGCLVVTVLDHGVGVNAAELKQKEKEKEKGLGQGKRI